MDIKFVKTRNGDIVPFDRTRIENAIERAMESNPNKGNKINLSFIESITDSISKELKQDVLDIENIQDIIEKVLIKNNFDIAKSFILYRSEKQKERAKQKEKAEKKLEKKTLKIIKSDGKRGGFNISKIRETYKRVSYKLARKCKFEILEESLKKYIVEGMRTSDITKMMVKSAIDLISIENTSWQFIAGRLELISLYKEASKNRNISIKEIYSPKHYLSLFEEYVEKEHYLKDFFDYYSKEEILEAGEYLNKDYDFGYNYTTMMMYRKRYLLNPNKVVKELPQEMYMSVALFLAMPELKVNRLSFAKKVYDACASGKISLPTPTLLNARTNFHQLSSCFVMSIGDDLRSIYHNIENMAQVSKLGGGIGVYLGNIRSKGGEIKGIKGVAGGVNPWIKVINDTAIAVNQQGKRAGAISVTLDIFHRDIYDFLELQTETGDIRSKAFDIFPAVTFPDLFMERVANNEDWTLFDPKEILDVTGRSLQDNFGEEFETFYRECENNSKIELKKVVSAKDLYKHYMKSNVETGMPYAFFRDTVNTVNPNKHCGNVYSSNLCTEITENMSPSNYKEEVSSIDDGEIIIKYKVGDVAVCNLASINVAKVNKYEEIEKISDIITRILDNVITLNFNPLQETRISANKYRPIGIGYLGLAEYLAVNQLSYDTQEARDEADRLFEMFAYCSYSSSLELAKERGAYPLFKGSEYSKGILLGKDANLLSKGNLGIAWEHLVDEIKEHGVRFGYTQAIAPNTSCQSGFNKVQTKKGITDIYQILEEQGFNKDTIELGEPQWLELKQPIEVPTKDGDSMVDKIWYNGIKEVREIEFEDGKKYKFTLNHKLLVDNNGIEEWVKVEDLEEGFNIKQI